MLSVNEPHYDLPEIPDDPTLMSYQELMQQFSRAVTWCNYFATKMTKADIDEKIAEAHLKHQEKVHLLTAEGRTVIEKKATGVESERLVRAEAEALRAWAERKAYEVAYDNQVRNAQFFSRELSRRQGDKANPFEGRSMRWTP